jgi:hypothetical protein
MAINASWNRRYGPGGGTRRLHQFYKKKQKRFFLFEEEEVWGQSRQAVAKMRGFENRSAAYLKVREHRKRKNTAFAARHHAIGTTLQGAK